MRYINPRFTSLLTYFFIPNFLVGSDPWSDSLTLRWLKETRWRLLAVVSCRVLGVGRGPDLSCLAHQRHGDRRPVEQSEPGRPLPVTAAAARLAGPGAGRRPPAEPAECTGEVGVMVMVWTGRRILDMHLPCREAVRPRLRRVASP